MLSVSDIKIYNDLHTRVSVSNKLRIKEPTYAPKEALKLDTGYPQSNLEKAKRYCFIMHELSSPTYNENIECSVQQNQNRLDDLGSNIMDVKKVCVLSILLEHY